MISMLSIIKKNKRYVVTCEMLGDLANFRSKIMAIYFIKKEDKKPF